MLPNTQLLVLSKNHAMCLFIRINLGKYGIFVKKIIIFIIKSTLVFVCVIQILLAVEENL